MNKNTVPSQHIRHKTVVISISMKISVSTFYLTGEYSLKQIMHLLSQRLAAL